MKRYFLILLLVTFIVPSVASAAWWNPFTWKIFSSKTRVEVTDMATIPSQEQNIPVSIQTPSGENLSCNGKIWDNCPSGQKFVCPAEQGDAYCEQPSVPKTKPVLVEAPVQQQLPAQNTSIATEPDMSKEIILKDRAIKLIDGHITAIESLDKFLIKGGSYINQVRRDNLGYKDELSVAHVEYADELLGQFKKANLSNQELLTYLYSERSSLQSQPLSYFSTYQIPQESYDFTKQLPEIVSIHTDAYNDFVDAISASNNLRSQRPKSTQCYFSGVGNGGVINCY